MTHQDATTTDPIISKETTRYPEPQSVLPGFNTVLKINHQVRALILDYTLAAAILGLIPSQGSKWMGGLNLLLLGLLNLKMMHDIRVRWGQPKGQDAFTILVSLLRVVGAFAIAIMTRLLISTVGLFIPLIVVWNGAVGHAMLTWSLGQTANLFYLSPKHINESTLKQMLQSHQRKS